MVITKLEFEHRQFDFGSHEIKELGIVNMSANIIKMSCVMRIRKLLNQVFLHIDYNGSNDER